ncbi:MAG TPA: hypothetical protein VF498_04355 [Anaerolineales bacterium]
MNLILFSVVTRETKLTSIATSNAILNLVIAIVSLIMFGIGILVCLGPPRTLQHAAQRQALVETRVVG